MDKAKPFLRWAGGKKWLIKYLPEILNGLQFNKYYEPFLGGGAIFFEINPKQAQISDLCVPLIETYQQIQLNPQAVIEALKNFNNTEEDYYNIRGLQLSNPIERAARFIYLNHTSFNGIYRENSRGEYNVPYGFKKEYLIDEKRICDASFALQGVEIRVQDFESIRESISKGDLVFLDPPYTVSHNDNGFVEYNQKIFKLEDQERLANLIDTIKEKGAFYILTNAAHKKIEEIFEKGDKKLTLSRASTIGGANAKRETIKEFIFTNI